MKYLVLALTLLIPIATLGQHSHSAKVSEPASLASGLGDVDHPVSTTNPEAQKFFNQGLAYMYGFNHEAAVRSFKRAGSLDPQLAMASWGIALALGSNYNLQADDPQLKEAYTNLQRAVTLSPKSSEHDRAYIEALAKRYSSDTQADRQKLALDYKNAMGELAKRYPDDLDAATLYAESMMNLRPWKLWSLDGKPAEGTEEIVAVLEGVLRRNPNHTGANHYYIHAVEASGNPERALPSAARLGKLAPKAGHLVHMPSHVYIRTGDYHEAAQVNADAIVADREYIASAGAQGFYPMMYYNHNIHFLAAANAMQGRYADSIKAARDLETNVKPHIKAMPMLEMFMPYTSVALVRFSKWDEILKAPRPDLEMKITTAYWHFARGTAFAGMNKPADAESEFKAFQSVVKTIPADAGFGNSNAQDVLKVAEQMLAGKIAMARGDKQTALSFLRKAVEAEDSVSYNEPADWDLPTRELLGGALLMNGDYAEAEKVFRAEIAKHQRNGRALFGLVESLKRQGKDSSGLMVQREFEKAWETADTKLSVEQLSGMNPKAGPVSRSNSEPAWRFSDIRLKTGVRLHFAEQGDPRGQPIIMLHGYTDSWFSYSRILPLMNTKYRVYVLDQRGHGDSDRPKTGYSIPTFAEDVLAFMDAKGLKQATIVGHSMGSFIAQHIAVQAPERVSRLVLVGSATTIRNDVVLELQRVVNGFTDPIPLKVVREFQAGTAFQPLPEEFMTRVVSESLKAPARVWRGVMTGMLAPDAKVELNKIRAPTLILWGDEETIFPRAEQEALRSLIPNAALIVYSKTGHALHWERPEQFTGDLEKFLSQNNPG
ncbi:MAG: alpha/beta fold hydrolase [Pyrinomonadaceae bacterium]|nr:alpha/beta fold hydrolase [Pyrinomonadaceae bacterium]